MAIQEKLDVFNSKPFQKKEGSRAKLFQEEQLFLLPLPPTPFELAVWKVATVQYNYHVSVDRMNYSVSYEYIKQQGYKSCMALLKSADKYSSARLEAACKNALAFTPAPSLKSIQSILRSGQDKLPDEDDTPTTTKASQYSFTRGAGYYRRDK